MKGHIRPVKYKGKRVSWAFVIDIGKDSNGKRKQKVRGGFKLERDAIEAMQQEIAKYHPDQPPPGESTITFEEHFTKWMRQHGALKWGAMTQEQNEKRAQYALRMFGNVPLKNLTATRIEEDLVTLLLRGGKKTAQYPKGRPLTPKTVYEVAALVSQSLDRAVEKKLITENPMTTVTRPTVPETEVVCPDPNGYERLLNRVKDTRYFALVVFAADAGCRRR
jgi:integrase